ncbi:Uma2 family endonuclease [Actinoplanes sp. NPDC049316]|uniref:Uma2 family endonuclease n=1 Tax=Actinoplanes sp. NPDC049316 TaxID=3154727 RepID=UPI0034345F60
MALPHREPSFDILGVLNEPWTAQLALDLLPEHHGPKVEVVRGSIVVTPHANYDHQDIELELTYRLKQAARAVGLWAYPEVNIVSGDDLFIPDIVVLRRSGGGKKTMPITEAVLLGEIVSSGNRRKDLIDRPREYAEAGVPYFLRIDFRNRVPGLLLHELRDGEYHPVVAAAAGAMFEMRVPFPFAVDPVQLLGEEG